MGRKTWDSIPLKFRPLKNRLNIVISRSSPSPAQDTPDPDAEPVRAGSLEEALEYLRGRAEGTLGHVFVIGGAQIYDAALKLPQARRLLITRILSDFECDTFFPLGVDERGECPEGWAARSKGELDGWAGEEVPAGVQEESGTRYEFQMWERT
ncbi:dihydrofolate reductase [Candidatus Bathyarchaeota archaeon]|nr:dihydrofolate reductase [Candidatus Bathyarchaeota archaeon]